uniref:Large ribosomal subunit protein bL20c n=1 Tax=Nephroselmis pyriformis TaxID=156128 RepID=A0A8A2H8C9_9CHLO|nr:ribosomal protein L20 [Nephroselmis pyriformis]QSV37249.1 ribosomal protein L20 [Nephroselmis pyriformis]
MESIGQMLRPLSPIFFNRNIRYMTRVKRGYVARKRRQRILKSNQGFRGAHSVLFRTANQQHMKALCNAYRDRGRRKREFRRLWIARINASVRPYGSNYNQFIHRLKQGQIELNRKMLAQLALLDRGAFSQLLGILEA